ncbi:MAG: asparagine synthase (glutamine-hydrolyzing) [Desulfobacterales bacterium]|nr:asparagine synthase (glutamine-hydrolyzing) [Desulfobacterales bacterium]
MCGIAGIVLSTPMVMKSDIINMTQRLRHRGPDGIGFVALNPDIATHDRNTIDSLPTTPFRIWLGHTRLSVIDIQGSHQPLCNEDGSVWVVFNGEIYNYLEIQKDLQEKGHVLREQGDTEVLVHLWEDLQTDMTKVLNGMFSFCIYDTKKNVIFIARDRFGKKPLYYWKHDSWIAFASELQGLFQLPHFPIHHIDMQSAYAYFVYGYIPSPKTIYSNVYSLLPGHWMTITSDNRLSVQQYWKPNVRGLNNSTTSLDAFEFLFDDAVRLRLRADVPLGIFLSGGIDSGLITASTVRQLDHAPKTFTISTGKSWCDESASAALTAAHLHTHHHVFKVSPDLISVAQKLALYFGQPFADYSSIPAYYVSRETRKHVTVALSGDGGDELFAGYMRYAFFPISRCFGAMPWQFRKSCMHLIESLGMYGDQWASIKDFLMCAGNVKHRGNNHSALFHEYWQQECFQPSFQNDIKEFSEYQNSQFIQYYLQAESDHPLERWLEADQRMYLADDILAKVDISSMIHGLECRSPFLDYRLAEAANQIPLSQKMNFGRTKCLLRSLASRRLPQSICQLPKKGFTLPLAEWLRNEIKTWAYTTIFKYQYSWDNLLEPKSIQTLWHHHQTCQSNHAMRLWIIISWCLWVDMVSHQ